MEWLFLVEQADRAMLHSFQANISPALTLAMLLVTFLGNPVFWFLVAAGLYWRGQENKGFFLVNLTVIVSALAGALKMVFMRPRPSCSDFEVLGLDDYGMMSFPSGHATMVAAGFSYAHKMVKRQWRWLFGLAVLLVAYSRIYLGMHFPTDVLAGLALGAVIGKLNLVARNKLFHRNFKPSKLEDELALVALIGGAVLAVLFLRSLPLAGLFLGFYAGFFLFKEMELSQSILLKRLLIVKYAIGFAALAFIVALGGGIVPAGIGFGEIQRFAMCFAGGFWTSWIWPVLWEKALRRM